MLSAWSPVSSQNGRDGTIGPDRPPGHVRDIRPEDCAAVLALVKALARYERAEGAVEMTEANLRAALFGPAPKVFGLVCEDNGQVVGTAIYFFNFSTWTGRHGLYLEDLFVLPGHRGKGLGRDLLRALARRAIDAGCARLEWSVLDWNAPAIGFYLSLGATAMDDWTVFRLSGERLGQLAGEPVPVD